MAKRRAADLTESEAPETVAPAPEPPMPVCDHCNVPMRPGATGLAFCPSCFRAQREVRA